MNPTAPTQEMIEVVERLTTFMERLDDAQLEEIFTNSDVTIIENFAPFIFKGPDAVSDWAEGMRAHLRDVTDLRHTFGARHDFSVQGDRAFFTLRTTWTGTAGGQSFSEEGGWSFVLVEKGGEWRIQAYGWAVTEMAVRKSDAG